MTIIIKYKHTAYNTTQPLRRACLAWRLVQYFLASLTSVFINKISAEYRKYNSKLFNIKYQDKMPIKRFTKMSSIPELWKFVVASLPVAPAVIELGKDALQALYFQLQSNPIVVNATLSAGGFTILYALYSRLKGPEDDRGEQLEKLVEAVKQLESNYVLRMAQARPATSTQGSAQYALPRGTTEQQQVQQIQSPSEEEVTRRHLVDTQVQQLLEKVKSLDPVQQELFSGMLSRLQNTQGGRQDQSTTSHLCPNESGACQEYDRKDNEISKYTNVTTVTGASSGFTSMPPCDATPHLSAGRSQESMDEMENGDSNLSDNYDSPPNSPFAEKTLKATRGEDCLALAAVDSTSNSRGYPNEAPKTTLDDKADVSCKNDSRYLPGENSLPLYSTPDRAGVLPIQDGGKNLSVDDKGRKSSTLTNLAADSKLPKSSGTPCTDSKRKRNSGKNAPSKKAKPSKKTSLSGNDLPSKKSKSSISSRRYPGRNRNPPPQHQLTTMTPMGQKIWEAQRRSLMKTAVHKNPNDAGVVAEC